MNPKKSKKTGHFDLMEIQDSGTSGPTGGSTYRGDKKTVEFYIMVQPNEKLFIYFPLFEETF